MIGIIYSNGEDPIQPDSSNPGTPILPDNLVSAGSWKFVATADEDPRLPATSKPVLPDSSVEVVERVQTICGHLRDGLAFLKAQEKGLHEVIWTIEAIGQLVSRRDRGYFPRVPESQLQEEFEILRIQLDGIRHLEHFNRPLYGNGGTPPLRIHTSLWDIPRFEEVSVADLEALSLRLVYWGKISGKGPHALIHQETVDLALQHLLEVTLHNQSQQDRLLRVLQSLSHGSVHDSSAADQQQSALPGKAGSLLPELEVGEKEESTAGKPGTLVGLGRFIPFLKHCLAKLFKWCQPDAKGPVSENKNFHHNQDAITCPKMAPGGKEVAN